MADFFPLAWGVTDTTAVVGPPPPPPPPTPTDDTNSVGGRTRNGWAVATWEPPVVPPPAAPGVVEGVVVAQAFGTPTIPADNSGPPTFAVSSVEAPDHRWRIVVGGRDVTYFRGVPTPRPSYSLVEPLLYGPAQIVFPQVAACFERPGVGALQWLRPGRTVRIQRVDRATGEVVATDYVGVVIAFGASGASLTVDVGGEASGRASLIDKQVPVFPRVRDVGRLAFRGIRDLRLPFTPFLGPSTGIAVRTFGGMNRLEYLQQLCAMAFNRTGAQWSIMPGADGVYRMQRKNLTTIAGTVYADDTRTVADLSRDLSEEPNRIFATAVDPEGRRQRFAVYPGLRQSPALPPYPYTDGRSFGVGTTDAATDTGDGVSILNERLRITGYLSMDTADVDRTTYTQNTADAVRALRADAGLFDNGLVNPAVWSALYDLNTTGYSLRWSRILPAAQRSAVRPWNLSASGARLGRNPGYDPTVLRVDRTIDMGTGFTRQQVREWSRATLAGQAVTPPVPGAANNPWVGSLTFTTGALVSGVHNPGDPLDESRLLRAADLRPGMNLWLPLFDGGTAVHVSAVTVGADGIVRVDVDSRARDSMAVWEVIARNRETRSSLARSWARQHRQSRLTQDSIGVWDAVGGVLGDPIPLEGGRWNVFPVVAGQEGTVARLRLRTSPAAEYVVAIFGRRVARGYLAQQVGNPLSEEGSKRWQREAVRDRLDRNHLLLYVAGTADDPCGFWPLQKSDPDPEGSGAAVVVPRTGRWQDDAGFPYRTFADPVLWVAVYPDRNTTIPAGRIMWNLLDAGV